VCSGGGGGGGGGLYCTSTIVIVCSGGDGGGGGGGGGVYYCNSVHCVCVMLLFQYFSRDSVTLLIEKEDIHSLGWFVFFFNLFC